MKFRLEEEFDIFLHKLQSIGNPFEQSIFILTFVPYFQIFTDINKRTSRMACNLPLLKNRLAPFSFLGVEPKEYITAILAVYELRDTSMLADLFVKNWLANRSRYVV